MSTEEIHVIGARPYESVRELCHRVKDNDDNAIREAAHYLAGQVPERALIVPIPSRWGFATNTLQLARMTVLFAGKRCTYANILKGDFRESLYDLKKAGTDIKGIDLGLRFHSDAKKILTTARIDKRPIILLDNVIDTGTTARACLHLIKDAMVMAIGDTQNWKT
ncbi:MAG: phosphoribosyltransferase [Bacteroidales bacterium]|nr:phosphoribosyltransferase [Bacteroidales bacterium]